MTLPRFRLRTLLVTVAATALVLAIGVTCQRMARLSSEYRVKASEWQRKAAIARLHAYGAKMHGPSDAEDARQAELYMRQAEYGTALTVKYKQAAAYPWRPVAPDPPEPR